jgi:hypothetical protein
MADQDYEILPHQLLEDLKYDVEELKKKLTEPDRKSEELILEVESLKDSIHELNTIFTKALESTKEQDVFKSIQKLNERIDAVVTQNETIARGMIAISDKVDEFVSGNSSTTHISTTAPNLSNDAKGMPIMPPPSSKPSGRPGTQVKHTMFPGPPPSLSGDVVPPPPERKKRKGFF